jgi:adenine-specific DNA-methyltransferase
VKTVIHSNSAQMAKPRKSVPKGKGQKKDTSSPALDFRYPNKRKYLPPAGIAAQGKVKETPKMKFAYDPHLPPALRFDPTGESDKLPELLATARKRALTGEEAQQLAEALRNREPWIEWAGKREKKDFEVDPVALHIHERISAQAILKIAARENVQRDLFADPQLDYRKAVQFYRHDVDWANRMILGDSLQVMASLARRENLSGQVQMIYIDPPYGIKFASNFQTEIGDRDVKDKEHFLSREPETVKAYRDTWRLGLHSYLTYLRDRLVLSKELLSDTGSIFVQISDENLHLIRSLLDEVFGRDNFVSVIAFKKTGYQASDLLPSNFDYLLFYAKRKEALKYRQLGVSKLESSAFVGQDLWFEERNGWRRRLDREELEQIESLDPAALFRHKLAESSGAAKDRESLEFEGRVYSPKEGKHFSSNPKGMERIKQSNRFFVVGNSLRYVNYLADFPVTPLTTNWADTVVSGFSDPQRYVVQTATKVVERCLLMTTDPGDLVIDPTCGGGTTAWVAEQWGRRWITIDTSRVALAIARQRILTSSHPFYQIRNSEEASMKYADSVSPAKGFVNAKVSHIMLRDIAQNVALDSIVAKYQNVLEKYLAEMNKALENVNKELRQRLKLKLLEKEKREGKKSVTDADRRRWLLPEREWREWEVPFDTDDDWPTVLKSALAAYRKAWREKMDEVNACIEANAEQKELVDQPVIVRGVVRVAGPFSIEAVMPAEENLETESPIVGDPEDLETFGEQSSAANEPVNAEAYLDKMLRLIRADGVRFPNNKVLRFSRLEPANGEYIHAAGEWDSNGGKEQMVGISFGPQYGPITAYQVENALRVAHRKGYDDLVFAGFSFDGAAQAIIQDDPNPKVRCHFAHIRPDVNMGDLLKETPSSQLFTVFGQPRTELVKLEDGQLQVKMLGVDIYNPVENTLLPTNADKVAAWFLDTDYDGNTFCITQAFFPDKSAWEKIGKALRGVIDEDRFEALSGTLSLPFPVGKSKRVAVKVIDPRGNEVMRVHRLDKVTHA